MYVCMYVCMYVFAVRMYVRMYECMSGNSRTCYVMYVACGCSARKNWCALVISAMYVPYLAGYVCDVCDSCDVSL